METEMGLGKTQARKFAEGGQFFKAREKLGPSENEGGFGPRKAA